jgi:hypothetical protein
VTSSDYLWLGIAVAIGSVLAVGAGLYWAAVS